MNLKQITHYAIIGLFSALALFVGIPKLFALEFMLENMSALGLPTILIQFAGLVWIASGIGVWFSKLRSWSALASAPIIFGAVGMHVVTDGLWYGILPNAVLALAVLYIDGFFSRVQS